METTPVAVHGRLYWLGRHFLSWIWRHKIVALIGVLLLILIVFLERASYQFCAIWLRTHFYLPLLGLPLAYIAYRQFKKRRWKGKLVIVSLVSMALMGSWYGAGPIHDYVSLYRQYHLLKVTDLDELPVTDHERIQPLNSVYSLAHEAMSDIETPIEPNFVRVGKEYRWTLGVEPTYPLSRFTGFVGGVYSVSGTSPSPNFSNEVRRQVHFPTGEKLYLGRNVYTSTIWSFGPIKFFNYQPTKVTYLEDDSGQWVQVVSLLKWEGIFFPRPQFGGVQLLKQSDPSLMSWLKRFFVGVGEWIPPEQIKDHPFLLGQNLVPYEVSRNMAESFRFQNGFLAPFPGYHRGDIRIPDLPEDVNDQPFTVFFTMPGQSSGGLHHYFGLEPYDPDKQGLNTSLFIPADGGLGTVYAYRHHLKTGSLTGVSAVSPKVMEARKQYDWERNRPVEHRPYIKKVGGMTRFFWLTTVVTLKDEAGKRFIAGSVPEVVITDAAYNTPVWVNQLAPDTWLAEIEKQLSSVWGWQTNKPTTVAEIPTQLPAPTAPVVEEGVKPVVVVEE